MRGRRRRVAECETSSMILSSIPNNYHQSNNNTVEVWNRDGRDGKWLRDGQWLREQSWRWLESGHWLNGGCAGGLEQLEVAMVVVASEVAPEVASRSPSMHCGLETGE
ncbi:uncharacterized protein DS421_12g363960 [Arachis hypogaea]|nr:uncharacterized protein DS421_12g363960 [Arachis hypogaea]